MDTGNQELVSPGVVTFPRVPARARAKAELHTQHQLLDTVFNNTAQGVLMCDSIARLIFCKQRYIEMYSLTANIAKPGCSLRHLLEHRVAAGTFSGDVDEYIIKLEADVAEGQISNTIVKCDDGRIFSILNK